MFERETRLQSHLNEIKNSSIKDISTIEKNFHNFLRTNYIVPELSSTLIDAYSLTVTSDPEKITITISYLHDKYNVGITVAYHILK